MSHERADLLEALMVFEDFHRDFVTHIMRLESENPMIWPLTLLTEGNLAKRDLANF